MSIEERVRRLEAREEIRELKPKYCYHIDAGNPQEFVDLFTEDGAVDFGDRGGKYQGSEELYDFIETVVPEHYSFIVHMVHNPVIEVDEDGDTATGTWYLESAATYADGRDAWVQGRYFDEYARTDDGWKISSVVAEFNYSAEYDEGWGPSVTE